VEKEKQLIIMAINMLANAVHSKYTFNQVYVVIKDLENLLEINNKESTNNESEL
jgi:hypothetical protein